MTNGNFVLGTAMTMTFFSGVAGFFLVLAVFLQTGFGLSPLQSGLTTVPFPLGVLIASIVSGRLGSRWPRERIAAGALLLVGGMVMLRFVVGGVGEAVDHWRFVLPLFLSGLGMGAAIAPLFQTVLSTVPPRDAGLRLRRAAVVPADRQRARHRRYRADLLFLARRTGLPREPAAHRGLRRQHVGRTVLRIGGLCRWSSSWCSSSGRPRSARKADTAQPRPQAGPRRDLSQPPSSPLWQLRLPARFGLQGSGFAPKPLPGHAK